jgi:anti-sigma-K factor RskA
MTENEDLDGLAAEYVLGSLSLAERREVDARRRQDAALDRAVADWERRLAPLSAGGQGIEPPPELYARITNRLWGTDEGASGGSVVPMPAARSRAGRLRVSGLVGVSALAACLLLAVGWVLLDMAAAPTLLVAELHRNPATAADEGAAAKGPPALRVALDLAAHSMTVTPATIRATPKRSFELWLLRSGGAAPMSLGLISHSAPTRVPWQEDYPTSGLVDDTLAVSLEPEGGSPTGAPSGPILFVGKLAAPPAR